MLHPRTRMTLESLEPRDVPSATTQTFDTTTVPALPTGWTQWSSDGSTAFATAAGQGVGGTAGLVTSGGSRTSALTWQTQAVSSDATVSADVQLSSLVPTFVFTRGTNLGTATPSYLAAVVTRGATVSIVQVTNGTATVLGSVTSPPSSYFSANWVQVTLVPSGSSVAVQVLRTDTNQYLNARGTWQSAATNALAVTTTLTAAGDAGIGRAAEYAGPVRFDNFSVTPPVSPPPAPPVSPPPAPVGSQSFDTTAPGATPAGWQSWVSNAAGTAGVSSALALSGSNSYALAGASNTAARAWSTTIQPAAVTASVAVAANSLIPAQLFVNGANLNTATPTYDAVVITRGLQASLVQVINGQTTTLATVTSSDYVTGQWVDVELTAQGTSLAASIYRTDTKQWLTAAGTWSSAPAFAFSVSNATSLAAGVAGIGRAASYYGTTNFDNFTAGAVGTVGPAVTVTSTANASAVSGTVTFQAAAPGAVGQVAFLLNGQLRTTAAASSASWALNSAQLANGTYTLTVLAGGADGTVGTGTYTFTVANAPSPPTTTAPQQPISANPTAVVSYALPPAADTLFGPNGPSYLDVHQGLSGDCWLIAALAEVAAQDPQAIRDMFTYDGTATENGTTVGVYTVRFFDSNNVARYVTIDTLLPAGGNYYNQPVNGVLWVALAEKAYAVANGLGYVTSAVPNSNTYAALYSGTAAWALQAITGKSAGDNFINTTQIATAVQAGGFVVLATNSPPDSRVLGNHAYAVVGYDASTGLFELMNPWGGTTSSNLSTQSSQVYGLFTATASFISANFSVESIGTR